MKEEEDYPYYETIGFNEEFNNKENSLCSLNDKGDVIKDCEGKPVLECMCGNIIRGRTDPSEVFFTEGGSFWTNKSSELNQTYLLNKFSTPFRFTRAKKGYESVALIPINSDNEIIGLLQLNNNKASSSSSFNLDMINEFEKIANIIGVIFALHVLLILLQYFIASFFARKNPFRLLANMMPAYFTALGTQSSAATIPVTLEQVQKNGVSEKIAGFVVPLCATIHLSGSIMKITACAMALMILNGMPFNFALFAGFIFMLGIAMIAAPGVPGGAIMAATGVLQSMLGFNEEMLGLMIALYIAMDSFGTACNITGDGAIALVVNRITKQPVPREEAETCQHN
jgi:hypothetical protein